MMLRTAIAKLFPFLLPAQLEIIREMNHHVRNALQVISLTTLQQDDESVRIMLRESVARIDWALREVLPGKRIAVRERLRTRRSEAAPAEKG